MALYQCKYPEAGLIIKEYHSCNDFTPEPFLLSLVLINTITGLIVLALGSGKAMQDYSVSRFDLNTVNFDLGLKNN